MKRCMVLLTVAQLAAAGSAWAQDNPRCSVAREDFVNGAKSSATMVMTNDGRPCDFGSRFGGMIPPDAWKLIEPPSGGTVTFEGDVARYAPQRGFTGQDRFTVAVFGNRRRGRLPRAEANTTFR